MSALLRYLICMTLVLTSTAIKNQVIGYRSADKNMMLSRLDKAFVDRTVYPPNRAQTPTSIPMYLPPNRGRRERKMRTQANTAQMMV